MRVDSVRLWLKSPCRRETGTLGPCAPIFAILPPMKTVFMSVAIVSLLCAGEAKIALEAPGHVYTDRVEKNSTFTKDKIGKDYLNTKAELTKLPVSKIVLRCNSTNYSIWVVGKNKVIFYDDLPSFAARVLGRLSRLF